MKIDLSIIIPVFNNSYLTKNALNDLMRLSFSHEIIIVDNGSADDTKQIVQDVISNAKISVKLILLPKNIGFGAANNKGYEIAIGRNILFLNNDIVVNNQFRDWTKNIIKHSDTGYLVGIDAGLLDSNFNFVKEGKGIDLNNPLSYLSGWCLGGSRKTFDRLTIPGFKGPWNENYFLYFEDDDLSWRARQLGIKMKLVSIPVKHYGRMTGKFLDMKSNFSKSRDRFIMDWKEK